ncbi:AhpD family alkylhydroperoxidase [Streptomyces sp. 3330]|uniref:carboxymuconolactone decarboxylase family protein n=1 Tax=Streptomyces sp. 3330 TaxID=2817755 RepID=UPI002854295F|nr:AhpD family alkylhydroperoxidase [Streptomyces sp. 3330]
MELVNISISQLNACAYCLSIHARDALEAGETQQGIAVLPASRDTELFTDQERAALLWPNRWSSFLTAANKTSTTARLHASSPPLTVISWASIVMNACNLASIISRHNTTPQCAIQLPSP